MASISTRSASALRSVSRRAQRAGSKISPRSTQTASYSLLARSAFGNSARHPAVQVKICPIGSLQYTDAFRITGRRHSWGEDSRLRWVQGGRL